MTSAKSGVPTLGHFTTRLRENAQDQGPKSDSNRTSALCREFKNSLFFSDIGQSCLALSQSRTVAVTVLHFSHARSGGML